MERIPARVQSVVWRFVLYLWSSAIESIQGYGLKDAERLKQTDISYGDLDVHVAQVNFVDRDLYFDIQCIIQFSHDGLIDLRSHFSAFWHVTRDDILTNLRQYFEVGVGFANDLAHVVSCFDWQLLRAQTHKCVAGVNDLAKRNIHRHRALLHKCK
jgi:hypothetical protein